MARSTARPVVRLKSTAGTGVTYVTRKNRLNHPDRLVLRKFTSRRSPCAAPGRTR
ncbi:50S ribosomal protein L33 [Streptomyces sp. AM6-12]|uniref:50S ribosomal protein L33 n=1 Tax=Streptomyces sp. AM6-12 TaxID=3345149 RepID=UPI0037B6ED3F